MSVGILALRLVIGGLFVGHGTQKLKGWFGGSGLEGTEKMMEKLDMHPTRANAIASGTAEAFGGALLATGLAVPVAASGLIGTMVTAVRKVHWKNGPWNSNRGWEYNGTDRGGHRHRGGRSRNGVTGCGARPRPLRSGLGVGSPCRRRDRIHHRDRTGPSDRPGRRRRDRSLNRGRPRASPRRRHPGQKLTHGGQCIRMLEGFAVGGSGQ
ncbi:hypothetical protein GCM10027052_00800 [Parafrigoribacterium mesophilum]